MQPRIGDGDNTLEATQKTGGFGRSRWTRAGRTEAATSLPCGPHTCRQGHLWREALSGDHVCVTPETRSRAVKDNRRASARRTSQP